MLRRLVTVAVVLGMLLGTMAAVSAAGYINFHGVDGEAQDKDHKGWVDVLSFSWGLEEPAPGSTSATRVSSGRVDFQDFSIVKTLDKASPKLALACCNGTHLPNVNMELCRDTGDKQKYMVYTFTAPVISSIVIFGPGFGDRPEDGSIPKNVAFEKITLRCRQIQWQTVEPKPGD